MSEPEICSQCGQPKPIKLVLRNEKTGENQLLCRDCSDTWLDSDEDWPEQKISSELNNPYAET